MWIKWLISALVISILSVCGAGYYYYHQMDLDLRPDTSKSKVTGLPDHTKSFPVVSPYAGNHPRQIQRPSETFSFPIALGETGPVEPLFAGPKQYPFLCQTVDSKLGQPLIDNQSGFGMPVYKELADGTLDKNTILGYSKDCSINTQVLYYYQPAAGERFVKFDGDKTTDSTLPDAVNWLRVEVGTINRFIYALVIPSTAQDLPAYPDVSPWNNKLIYHFKGGISIGYHQGALKLKFITKDLQRQLEQGYAVAYSTGTETSNHYDIWLSEDTALRVKKQFTSQFGEPEYTIGIGGSGGALQQYLLAQNHPGIIDGGVAQYSYPDMVTQVGYALDCELLAYYFDVLDRDNADWEDWEKREIIEGLSNVQDFPNTYSKYKVIVELLNLTWPTPPKGASECSNGWRGPHATIHNPAYTGDYYRYSQDVYDKTQWSHWYNLVHYYGTDQNGWANSLFDNQGVQYGLSALLSSDIRVETFLDLNRRIGGWKPQSEMENEYYWHVSGNGGLKDFKLWSQHNMTHEGESLNPAPRSIADPKAVEAAYRSGHLFTGLLDIPIIDLRHYLDEQLDIHHSWASVTTRKRVEKMMGEHGQQLIWTAMKPFLPMDDALDALDRWIKANKQNPTKSVAENRPDDLNDRCYESEGQLVYNGPDAWDGKWNKNADGPCQSRYPMKSSSRLVAGDTWEAETLKCQLQSVQQAIQRGVYGSVDMTPHQKELEAIFPDGVCDFESEPQGKPMDMMMVLKQSSSLMNTSFAKKQ